MPSQHTSIPPALSKTIKSPLNPAISSPPGFIFQAGVYWAEVPNNNHVKCLQNTFKPPKLGSAWLGAALWKVYIPVYNELHHLQEKEVPTPFSTSQATPGMLCSVLVPNMLKRHGWAGERRATKLIKGLGSLPCDKRLRKLGSSAWKKKEGLREFQSLNGWLQRGCRKEDRKEDDGSLFIGNHMEKIWGKGYKLLPGDSVWTQERKFSQ